MRNARAAFWVGLVVVIGAIAFVAMYSVSRKRFASDVGSILLYARFDDGTGLGPGTRITVAGVAVGEIISVGIDPESPEHARVDMTVRADIKLMSGDVKADGTILDGAVVKKQSASLLGDQYLELTAGSRGKALQNGDRIPTAISVTGLAAVMKEMEKSGNLIQRIDGIFEKLDVIAEDVRAVTGSVRAVMGTTEGTQRFERIAANVERTSADMSEVVKEVKTFAGEVRGFLRESVLGRGDQISRIIGNIERFTENAAVLSQNATASADKIMENVEVVTRDVRELISGSRGDVESSLGTIRRALASFTRTIERLEGAIDSVRETVVKVNSIVSKIDDGKGTIGRLVNDTALVDQMEEVVTDAGDFVKRVTRIETKVEIETQYLGEAEAFKTYVRLRFQPSQDKYYLLELVDDPAGKTEVVKRKTISDGAGGTTEVDETVEETKDEFKISLMFAKRWYFLTGRFGLLESSGGLGLDFEFFEDSLKVTMDLFDFAGDTAPRMRFFASWTFLEHIAITAGVDNTLVPDDLDWFVGFGIKFTDADLKALLTVAPSVP